MERSLLWSSQVIKYVIFTLGSVAYVFMGVSLSEREYLKEPAIHCRLLHFLLAKENNPRLKFLLLRWL